jgi:hypothetical protein
LASSCDNKRSDSDEKGRPAVANRLEKRNGKNGRRISRKEEAIEEMSPLKIISFVDCFNWLTTKKRGAESRRKEAFGQGTHSNVMAKEVNKPSGAVIKIRSLTVRVYASV